MRGEPVFRLSRAVVGQYPGSVRNKFKMLMVGTAAVLSAAGCSATGTANNTAALTGASPSAGSAANAASSGNANAPANSDAVGADGARSASGSKLGTAGTDQKSATAAAGKVTIYGCDHQPVSQPTNYVLFCGDGNAWLDKMAWSDWGAPTATGKGTYVQNDCQPNCAAGKPVSAPATATLSALKDGHYTKLHIVTPKGNSDFTIDAQGPLVTG